MKWLFDANPSSGEPAEGCPVEGDHQICTHRVSLGSWARARTTSPPPPITIDELRDRKNGLVLAGSVKRGRVARTSSFPRPTVQLAGTSAHLLGTGRRVVGGQRVRDRAQVDGGYPLVIGKLLGVSWTGGLQARDPSADARPSPTCGWAPSRTSGNPFNGSILVLTNVGAHWSPSHPCRR